jgi:hypothetical protein
VRHALAGQSPPAQTGPLLLGIGPPANFPPREADRTCAYQSRPMAPPVSDSATFSSTTTCVDNTPYPLAVVAPGDSKVLFSLLPHLAPLHSPRPSAFIVVAQPSMRRHRASHRSNHLRVTTVFAPSVPVIPNFYVKIEYSSHVCSESFIPHTWT